MRGGTAAPQGGSRCSSVCRHSPPSDTSIRLHNERSTTFVYVRFRPHAVVVVRAVCVLLRPRNLVRCQHTEGASPLGKHTCVCCCWHPDALNNLSRCVIDRCRRFTVSPGRRICALAGRGAILRFTANSQGVQIPTLKQLARLVWSRGALHPHSLALATSARLR